MAQNTDNTWSATEAKENSQEIAKLVSVQTFFFLYLIVIKFLRHAHHCFIFLEFFIGGQFVVAERWRWKIGRW